MIEEIKFRKSYEFMIAKDSQRRFPVRTIMPDQYSREKEPYDMFEIFTKGLTIPLKDINIIVGENGSGKSTLISLIRSYMGKPRDKDAISLYNMDEVEYDNNIIQDQRKHDLELVSKHTILYKNCVFFDGENDNPAITIPKTLNPDKKDFGNMVAFMWEVGEESHGESMIPILDYILDNARGILIFMDEPETALSLKNQIRLGNQIKKAAKHGNQLIISTHSMAIMSMFEELYDMESREWVNSKDYIDACMTI